MVKADRSQGWTQTDGRVLRWGQRKSQSIHQENDRDGVRPEILIDEYGRER